VKTPKIYFYDVGLACSLLGINSAEEVATHYLRGGLFESLILSDFMKQRFSAGREPSLYFWRDQHGHEVDCVVEQGGRPLPIEIKSSQTISSDFFDGLTYWSQLAGVPRSDATVVYAGDESQTRTQGRVIGWKECATLLQ
jgi:predicted AAA+ superfamily ATPase